MAALRGVAHRGDAGFAHDPRRPASPGPARPRHRVGTARIAGETPEAAAPRPLRIGAAASVPPPTRPADKAAAATRAARPAAPRGGWRPLCSRAPACASSTAAASGPTFGHPTGGARLAGRRARARRPVAGDRPSRSARPASSPSRGSWRSSGRPRRTPQAGAGLGGSSRACRTRHSPWSTSGQTGRAGDGFPTIAPTASSTARTSGAPSVASRRCAGRTPLTRTSHAGTSWGTPPRSAGARRKTRKGPPRPPCGDPAREGVGSSAMRRGRASGGRWCGDPARGHVGSIPPGARRSRRSGPATARASPPRPAGRPAGGRRPEPHEGEPSVIPVPPGPGRASGRMAPSSASAPRGREAP